MDRRRFFIEFTACMSAYVAVLIGSLYVINLSEIEGGWKTLIALAPMLPGACVAVTVLRQVISSDELQRQFQLEALSLAFCGTAFAIFSYGFLENVGYPKLSMFYVWPLMAALWIIGGLISGRRYR